MAVFHRREGLSTACVTSFPPYFLPMGLAPMPEPAEKRSRGRVMSGDAAAAEARIMEGLAREAAGLGVEIVDVAGNIEDVSARVAQQARSFTGLVASAGAVNDSNRRKIGRESGREGVCQDV